MQINKYPSGEHEEVNNFLVTSRISYVIFQNVDKMSIFHVLTIAVVFLYCVNGNVCLNGKCYCFELTGVIHCTQINLETVPWPDSALRNYTSLLLRYNHLKHFNFSLLASLLPQVELIDLRYNNPILCEAVLGFTPPYSLSIISNCEHPTSMSKTYFTMRLFSSTSSKTKQSMSQSSFSFSELNTSWISTTLFSALKSSTLNQEVVYICTITFSILVVPCTLILTRLIIRRWRLRNELTRNPSIQFQLSPLNINSEE